nr:RNase E specificity factor CsrD [Vibrio stylophorae]
MKLTNRLVAFVTLIVVGAIFVVFVGGAISFQRLGNAFIERSMSNMVTVLDRQLARGQSKAEIAQWLPTLLQGSDITKLVIQRDQQVVFEYQSTQINHDLALQFDYPLPSQPGYQVHLVVQPAYKEITESFEALSALSIALILVMAGLVWGGGWLRRQFAGAELLEYRARMILAGRGEKYSQGHPSEWPAAASQVIDNLMLELKDARQERSRFDTFIRTHTFLDQLTGAANRVLFDSRLQAVVQEQGSYGGVIFVRLTDWEDLSDKLGHPQCDELIQEVSVVLSNAVQRYPDAVLSRYFDGAFAIMLAQQAPQESASFAAHLMRLLARIAPPAPVYKDNWFHIGMTTYQQGDSRGRLMDELEMALRSAELDGANSWHSFDKPSQPHNSRGSVRWRTLFEAVLAQGGPALFEQPVFMTDGKTRLHDELFARIRDENGVIIKASRFMPALSDVGMNIAFDKAVVQQGLKKLLARQDQMAISLNLSGESLINEAFQRWLRYELLSLPRAYLPRIYIETTEGFLVQHLDAMRPIAHFLVAMGCKLVVDQAGRTVVSTYYIKDLKVDVVKLHRSLIRDIGHRPENQLFIRSLLGACGASPVSVIAVGVETEAEWQVVRNLGVQGVQGRYFGAELSQQRTVRTRPNSYQRPRTRWSKK